MLLTFIFLPTLALSVLAEPFVNSRAKVDEIHLEQPAVVGDQGRAAQDSSDGEEIWVAEKRAAQDSDGEEIWVAEKRAAQHSDGEEIWVAERRTFESPQPQRLDV